MSGGGAADSDALRAGTMTVVVVGVDSDDAEPVRHACPTAGVKLGRIPPDRRSGTSYLRSTTSNNRSCTPQLRSGTFLFGSTLCTVIMLSIFLRMHNVL